MLGRCFLGDVFRVPEVGVEDILLIYGRGGLEVVELGCRKEEELHGMDTRVAYKTQIVL